jgi:hypothetical protein
MAGTSLFTAADIADLAQANLDTFATLQAIADPPIDLVLERGETVLAAQRVILRYETDRSARRLSTSDGAAVTLADGWFEKELPFDVAVNDRFVIGGMPGYITGVPFAQLGKQLATFKVDQGSV